MLISSTGSRTRFLRLFMRLSARRKEIGPTRPKYIVMMMMILPAVPSAGVSPLESPTVPMALTTSKSTSIPSAPVTSAVRTEEMNVSAAAAQTTG